MQQNGFYYEMSFRGGKATTDFVSKDLANEIPQDSVGYNTDFSAVDSGTVRLGYRLTTRISPISRLYTGLMYQYEFNGSTDGKYRSYTTPEAKVKGSSGMLELGWQLKADKKTDWMVDFNVAGWVGMQKGISAGAKIKKSF